MKERNIRIFNSDIRKTGKYIYSDFSHYSAKIATSRQTRAIVDVLHKFFPKSISILDVGSGDGTFTLQLLSSNRIKRIIGFDIAKDAVARAKRDTPKVYKRQISYRICNIYATKRIFGNKKFDLAVVRGVLHHVYNPEKAIRALSFLPYILVLEPNGYNPILKIIEKISPYHRNHEEKSYYPPMLNNWFRKNGYHVVTQQFVGIVPYFFPVILTKILTIVEPVIERIPFFHVLYTGSNVILYKRITPSSK